MRAHPHVLASLVGALLLGAGGLIAPRPGSVPSGWPPPWAGAWCAGVVVTCSVVLLGMAVHARSGSVAGWLVQRAGHVAVAGLHGTYCAAAVGAFGWHALDAAGFVGSLAIAHVVLAYRMGRELVEARTVTAHPPDPPEGA